ncbi:hypothetical protein EMCRGX_G017570 [Ephydatia muelleri]
MAVPLVFVSTVFNVILSLLSRRLKTIHFLMLVMSDLMGLNLLFGTLGAGWRLVFFTPTRQRTRIVTFSSCPNANTNGCCKSRRLV